jgi:hypothetical protein
MRAGMTGEIGHRPVTILHENVQVSPIGPVGEHDVLGGYRVSVEVGVGGWVGVRVKVGIGAGTVAVDVGSGDTPFPFGSSVACWLQQVGIMSSTMYSSRVPLHDLLTPAVLCSGTRRACLSASFLDPGKPDRKRRRAFTRVPVMCGAPPNH